jgi:hypothetical protein
MPVKVLVTQEGGQIRLYRFGDKVSIVMRSPIRALGQLSDYLTPDEARELADWLTELAG